MIAAASTERSTAGMVAELAIGGLEVPDDVPGVAAGLDGGVIDG
jgi:hypothetical protein